MGKLRMQPSGEYVLYDNGSQAPPVCADDLEEDDDLVDAEAQEKSSAAADLVGSKATDESSLYRKEYAIIHFSSKVRPTPQKGMEVCIPNPTTEMKAEGQLLDTIGSKKTMLTKFAKLRAEGTQNESYSRRLYILNEKQSRYDPLSSCLVDFKGRANLASVKNFQIVESVALGPPEREAKASGSYFSIFLFIVLKFSISLHFISYF